MSGPTYGQQRVTTTARSAAHDTCRPSAAKNLIREAKTRRTAHPNQTEAAMSKSDKSGRIRELNDHLRRTFTGGKVVMTDGVAALAEDDLAQLLTKVRSFDEFTSENDPYGEHDFGKFELAGQTYFFKLDYYAPDMDGGSEDPADPTKTTRVLTIMRADEY
jgi:Protein of unknown function (DUF3768)